MMRYKKLKETAGVLALAATLFSCGTFRTETGSNPSPSLVRHAEIPQMQIDAAAVYARMVSYVTPEICITVPRTVTQKLTAYIAYPAGSITVDSRYGNNRAELEKLYEQLDGLLQGRNPVKNVRLTGYASPDGNTLSNERLAANRVLAFKKYLQDKRYLPDDSRITIDWVGEDWEGLVRLMETAPAKSYASRVQALLDSIPDADIRRRQLRNLNKGTVYKDLERSIFARLRRIELEITYEEENTEKDTVDMDVLVTRVYSSPEKMPLEELLQVASLYRPGTEQYREIYELAAYRFPDCRVAQLNASAASLALGDKEAARYFLQRCSNDPRSYNNQGVLLLMEGETDSACGYFRKAMPENPRLARENLSVALKAMSLSGM